LLKPVHSNAEWIATLATTYGSGQYCPETVKAGASDWKNIVGTGPFKYQDYVVGSYISMPRTRYYYGKANIGASNMISSHQSTDYAHRC